MVTVRGWQVWFPVDLPPGSPKLNGHVERAHRTHIEAFHEVYDGELDLPNLNQALNQ